MGLGEYLQKYRSKDNAERFKAILNGEFVNGGGCDYDGVYVGDDEEDEFSEMSPVEIVSNNATVLDAEKKKPDMSGTSMDSQLILHPLSGDEEKTHMDIEHGASEENMATERKKKEKRKTQEDGFESEKNDGIVTAIEVKKKKDSISKSAV